MVINILEFYFTKYYANIIQGDTMKLSENTHLPKEKIIKNGSYFTPEKITKIAKSWIEPLITENSAIIDFGVGYGAFISNFLNSKAKLIATDIDTSSIKFINNNFPQIKTYQENSLLNINKSKYGLKNENIIIIGNPPYNDITSYYKKGEKGFMLTDKSVKSRDLGISFLKMYSLINPNFICVLHPLSYLIKKTNFNSLGDFKKNYTLVKGLIFSSNLFSNINKSNIEFPVTLGLYKKNDGVAMDFNYISSFKFDILEHKDKFILSNYKTIDGIVPKYPNKNKLPGDLQFYTMRDMNALKRNKTFVNNLKNGVSVYYFNLHLYAWIDFLKNNFKTNQLFLYGNLSPLYSPKIEEEETKKALIYYIYNNNQIVKNYIENNKTYNNKILAYYKINSYNGNYDVLFQILKDF
jgi:hypothetical protein